MPVSKGNPFGQPELQSELIDRFEKKSVKELQRMLFTGQVQYGAMQEALNLDEHEREYILEFLSLQMNLTVKILRDKLSKIPVVQPSGLLLPETGTLNGNAITDSKGNVLVRNTGGQKPDPVVIQVKPAKSRAVKPRA